jgi:DNA-binding CsgD family transcriptional regulator
MGADQEGAPVPLREVAFVLLKVAQLQLTAIELMLRESDSPEPTEAGPEGGAAAAAGEEDRLTPRESEVLRLLGQGYSNRRIGRALGISEHTVRAHLQTVFRKLGAEHRTDAVLIALRAGLIAWERADS